MPWLVKDQRRQYRKKNHVEQHAVIRHDTQIQNGRKNQQHNRQGIQLGRRIPETVSVTKLGASEQKHKKNQEIEAVSEIRSVPDNHLKQIINREQNDAADNQMHQRFGIHFSCPVSVLIKSRRIQCIF